jgi:DNA repair exonuclease SbcCD ATPase subunit
MQDLALEIAKRAEELESLSEIALHEKREGNLAMDEAEKFNKELDSKLEFIQNSFAQLRKEEDRINKEKIKLHEESKVINETKDTIVCNLCGSGLNRG